MIIPPFIWLIGLPLLGSPLVYLVGRLVSGRLARGVGLLVLLAAWLPFVATWQALARGERVAFTLGEVTLQIDGVSLLVTAVILLLTPLIALFSARTLDGAAGTEKYDAMLLAISGSMIGLSCATDLFNLWLWFEAMTITSYLLVAFHHQRLASLEAGVKYLLQSAVGSMLVLFGVALVLAQSGTLSLAALRQQAAPAPLLLAACALFVVGFGVKLAIVPLHTWLPDAYAEAPSGVSALLSGVVTEMGLVALFRVMGALTAVTPTWGLLLLILGAVNMLVGNLLAVAQTQVKRLLAFSSLCHIGYMLIGLGITLYSGELLGVRGSFFHLLTHGLTKGLAFLAAGALLYGLQTAVHDPAPLTIAELSGSAWRYPLAAGALSLALLGLGGVPPLAGFMSKWQILLAGMGSGQPVVFGFVAFAALNSVLSLAYYAPLVQAVFRREMSAGVQNGRSLPLTMNLPILLLALVVVTIGLWPGLVAGLTEGVGGDALAVIGY